MDGGMCGWIDRWVDVWMAGRTEHKVFGEGRREQKTADPIYEPCRRESRVGGQIESAPDPQ